MIASGYHLSVSLLYNDCAAEIVSSCQGIGLDEISVTVISDAGPTSYFDAHSTPPNNCEDLMRFDGLRGLF